MWTFELTIISPSTGSEVLKALYIPTTFSGVGQDRDKFGNPVGASSDNRLVF